MTLIGDPLDPTVVDNTPDVTDDNETGGTSLMTYIQKYGVIAGGIIVAILGILALMVFLRRGSSMPSFPSNNEPAPSRNDTPDNHNTPSAPTAANTSTDHDSTPDWLRESESPFGGEDILAKSADDTSHNDSHGESTIPDWAKDSPDETPSTLPPDPHVEAPKPIQQEVSTPSTPMSTSSDDDIPDWLK